MERTVPWQVVFDLPQTELALGPHRFDIAHRALLMAVIDIDHDHHALRRRAAGLVADGADALALQPAPGARAASTDEELDTLVPAVATLHGYVEVPLCVQTSCAAVLRDALAAGAVAGEDRSGLADPGYLDAVAAAEATVVVTHDVPPQAGEPAVESVARFLADRAGRASAAGAARERIVLDAGVALAETPAQSLALLRAHDRLAALGLPLALSTGEAGGREANHAAHALGIALGVRLLRTRDVRGARRVADVMAAVLAARRRGGSR